MLDKLGKTYGRIGKYDKQLEMYEKALKFSKLLLLQEEVNSLFGKRELKLAKGLQLIGNI